MSTPVVPADIQELARLVRAIHSTLRWLVAESRHIPEGLRPAFSVVLPNVLERLDSISASIENITEDDLLYQSLAEQGLTGEHLAMKSAVGKFVSDALASAGSVSTPQPSASVPRAASVGRFLRPVLGWINSILGSLEKVFPPAGAVKEFKEHAEVAVEFSDSVDVPPRGVLP